MPITEKQKQNRNKYIGASEAAAVLGVSPWKTAYDVWLEKTGKIENPYSAGEAADIGNMVENGLIDWCGAELGKKTLKNQFRVHGCGFISATHDALLVDMREGVEAKTAGIMNPFAARDTWGDEGTDEIPDHYVIQCQQQCLVSGLAGVHVPALIGGRGRVMYRVERSERLCALIMERVTAFWVENVQADIPPEGVPSLDVIRIRKREPGKTISIPADLVQTWQMIAGKKKDIAKAEDQAKAAVLAAMQDAEIGESEAGNVKITKSKRKGYTVKESEVVRVNFTKSKLLKG